LRGDTRRCRHGASWSVLGPTATQRPARSGPTDSVVARAPGGGGAEVMDGGAWRGALPGLGGRVPGGTAADLPGWFGGWPKPRSPRPGSGAFVGGRGVATDQIPMRHVRTTWWPGARIGAAKRRTGASRHHGGANRGGTGKVRPWGPEAGGRRWRRRRPHRGGSGGSRRFPTLGPGGS